MGRGGGHELSGALLDSERSPSNIIRTLFDKSFEKSVGDVEIEI